MILFLTSSPCIYKHSPATLNPANGFLDRLRSKLPPKPHTLFICSDPDSHAMTDYFAQDMFGAFRRAGIHFGGTRILDGRSWDQARMLIAWADFIILMGGHVPTQNAFFHEIGLKRLLAGHPGVLMGISAGTMNAAGEVYAQPEEPGESAPSFRRFYPGLGLTDVNVCPHYQEVVEKDLRVDGIPIYPDLTAADSLGREFYIFPDGTYLYQDETQSAIHGECWRLRDGIMEHLTEDGQHLSLPR